MDRVLARSQGRFLDEALLQALSRHCAESLDGIDRINRLVGDLRRLGQERSGERHFLPLDGVVARALEIFRVTRPTDPRLLHHDLQETAPLLLNAAQIQHVVLNLLENAAAATREKGIISLRVAPHAEGAELVVEDTGQGIPPEILPHIFDEFFTTKPEGTGLGLAIARRIVESHLGTIRCESEVGKGTRFTILLPASAPPGPPGSP